MNIFEKKFYERRRFRSLVMIRISNLLNQLEMLFGNEDFWEKVMDFAMVQLVMVMYFLIYIEQRMISNGFIEQLKYFTLGFFFNNKKKA